jgi:galactokinase
MISTYFREHFQTEPAFLVRSPGRINLIGEHTDYNDGFVMPAAIDRYVNIAIGARTDGRIGLYAVQFNDYVELSFEEVVPQKSGWTNYVLGVVDQLLKRNYPVTGFNIAVDGDVPAGAGLSSSAAIECAMCFALARLFDIRLDKFEIALIGQKAEHTFPGVMCGIMDQFASACGEKDHALKLDCRSLQYESLPLILKDYVILLLNSNINHSLASTAYNERREQCAEGVARVQEHEPKVRSLRDVSPEMLGRYITDPLIRQRCTFVVEENLRVEKAAELLKAGNIEGLGQLMYGSHDGLSKKYEVSCKELDWLVDAVRSDKNVAGSRMMGGGFGGCTINLIKQDAVEGVIEKISAGYASATGRQLTPYVATTANGTEEFSE